MFDLKQFRKEKKLRQNDVALTIGVSQIKISRYEKGIGATEKLDKVLLKHYPELGNFEIKLKDIRSEEVSNDDLLDFLKSKEAEQSERVKELKEMIRILKDLMNGKDEKIKVLEDQIKELQNA